MERRRAGLHSLVATAFTRLYYNSLKLKKFSVLAWLYRELLTVDTLYTSSIMHVVAAMSAKDQPDDPGQVRQKRGASGPHLRRWPDRAVCEVQGRRARLLELVSYYSYLRL